jgi:alpha-ribazole phosphatase
VVCSIVIVLIRHPRADIRDGICYGRTDLALADPADIAPIAAALRTFVDSIWTSPAQRCRVVAEAIGPARIDARLLELDFGEWEGRAWDDVPRSALDAWAADPWRFAPPGGESGAALVARVRCFATELAAGDHVIVSHGGPLKVLRQVLRDEPIDLLAPAPGLGSVTTIG